MFSILKRSKKLVLNCYTHDKNVYQTGKPNYSSKFLPNWWKNLDQFVYHDNNFFPSPTMKNCLGIIQYYSRGIIIPLWCDLAVEIGERGTIDFRWQYADKKSEGDQHPMHQMGHYLDEREYSHLKLYSPWLFEMSEDISWTWTEPTWNTLKQYDYKILPAVTEYKSINATHINMLFSKGENRKRLLIEHGTPMVHLIPITERRIEIKHHLISEQEWKIKLKSATEKFYKTHSYHMKLIDRIESEQSKCPFSKFMKR